MNERIPKQLQPFAVEINTLSYDPANARKHGEKNINAIKGSLARFGQQKPIVINSSGVVVAGNWTLQAARLLGWESIAVVQSSLEGAELTAFGIADNRTAELAEWDDETLMAHLSSLENEDFDLSSLGMDGLMNTDDTIPIDISDSLQTEFRLEILLNNEQEQQELFNELSSRGISCRVLTL